MIIAPAVSKLEAFGNDVVHFTLSKMATSDQVILWIHVYLHQILIKVDLYIKQSYWSFKMIIL